MRDSKRDTGVFNSLLYSVGEGKGGMIWENGIETCKLSHVKSITSSGLMHETGEDGGRGDQDGCIPMEDLSYCMAKPIQYCKVK